VIGVLVSGAGTNLQALLDAGLPVAAVASNKPGVQASERARRAQIAHEAFPLDAYRDRAERDAAMAEWLLERRVELVVCAGYMHLLTTAFLDRFPGRVINVHPSLLPRFPGVTALQDALAAGVAETGVSVHYVDEGLDTGPVIRQERLAIVPGEAEDALLQRVHAVEHRLLPEVVRELLAERRPVGTRP
jgi:phosphoribosylglycinamide formyltransferase 1